MSTSKAATIGDLYERILGDDRDVEADRAKLLIDQKRDTDDHAEMVSNLKNRGRPMVHLSADMTTVKILTLDADGNLQVTDADLSTEPIEPATGPAPDPTTPAGVAGT
jgi:hypothetical protein